MTDVNDRTDEANVPREPWKRLLEASADGPPETTDARIRAAARRDLAPRGQRWWLPASLAASFVLAVLIVRSEFGTGGRIPIAETARGGDEAIAARIIERDQGPQAREPGQAPAAPSRKASKQHVEAESDVYGYADSELGSEAAGTGPLVGGPERELQAASEMPEERAAFGRAPPESAASSRPANAAAESPVAAPAAASGVVEQGAKREPAVAGGSPRRESNEGASPWTPPHVAAPVDNVAPQPSAAPAARPTPEAWYAAIEKLRREGRSAEADRELERLRKAYPGWLEEHLRKTKPP